MVIGNSKGVESSPEAKSFKGKYEAKLEYWRGGSRGGGGGLNKKKTSMWWVLTFSGTTEYLNNCFDFFLEHVVI